MLWLLACVEIRVESGVEDDLGAVEAVVVRSDAGDLTVEAAEAPCLSWEAESSGDMPDVDITELDGQLVVDVACRDALICRVDLRLGLPAAASLQLETGDGHVRVEAARATDLWARTDLGDIVVEGASGTVDLDSGAGSVEASGLSSAVARGSTSMGDVSLAWSGGVVQSASVESGMGDVELRVPAGVYEVEASSDLGDVSVDVQTGEGAGAVLSAHTGAGDVVVESVD